ncbi:MAG: NADH:flavin oxidoreductase/NADH oxidase [Gemmatimonadetes bacterium]|nr:NADH:flavin oxidoreductase/NADH oxidase [Gemmatimonadota bacterium]
MSALFSPLTLRGLTLANRVGVSPMCQYSGVDGVATDWHLAHLGAFATGGAALVFTEAVAVVPEGRISPQCLGIWNDEQLPMLHRITDFLLAQGAVPGIQLAHAGRKASTTRPWEGHKAVPPEAGGWSNVVAPSAIAFNADYPQPVALTRDEIPGIVDGFVTGAQRALAAGFRVAEVHAAHGYLLHQFLSPLSNTRTDDYGGSFDNRVRLTREVVRGVRAVWPDEWPLFVRLSTTDWVEGGWTLDETVQLSAQLREDGADVIDCSSGGLSPAQKIAVGPGYQVPFARRVRVEAGVATAAVGLITEPAQAEAIVADGSADLVLLAREMLRNPHWALHAAHVLGGDVRWAKQYERARPR